MNEYVLAWCDHLADFADFIESNSMYYPHDFLVIPALNNDSYYSLWNVTVSCIIAIELQFYDYGQYYYYYYHDDDGNNYTYGNYDEFQAVDPLSDSELYEIQSCHMSTLKNKSYTSNGVLSFPLYTYLTLAELPVTIWLSPADDLFGVIRSVLSESYLHTCTAYVFKDDEKSCVNHLLRSCFLIDHYDPYLCYFLAIYNFCYQFEGDDHIKCLVILEEISNTELEDTCSFSDNDAKCVRNNYKNDMVFECGALHEFH